MDEAEMKRRTKAFALRCMKLADSLPRSISGRAIANQLMRCGTAVGANYRAACRGRSKAEFTAKLGIVLEEADESSFWMELIVDSGMKRAALVRPLLDEADQLVRILASSILSSKARGDGQRSKI
jgi:four helix bundle protein